MSAAFDRAVGHLLQIEGGYSDDAKDSGGKTKYGITEATARRHGYTGEMRELPLETAKAIYKAEYWDGLLLDQVSPLSQAIAFELFDTAVNCGVGVARAFLQRALNAFNLNGTAYPDLPVGARMSANVAALQAYLAKRGGTGEQVMLRALNSQQGARYLDLVELREKDEKYVFGWFRARVST